MKAHAFGQKYKEYGDCEAFVEKTFAYLLTESVDLIKHFCCLCSVNGVRVE